MSLAIPEDARRAFGVEDFARRLVSIAGLTERSRVLDLGSGDVGILLAREIGLTAVCVQEEGAALVDLKARAERAAVGPRVECRARGTGPLDFAEGTFDAVFLLDGISVPPVDAFKKVREHLVPNGRVSLIYPLRVGRAASQTALEHWQKKLNAPLLMPKDILSLLQKEGFEPETVDSLSDEQLDAYYDVLEDVLNRAKRKDPEALALREDVRVHRTRGATASVTWAWIVGRRRELNEKPPPSRDVG